MKRKGRGVPQADMLIMKQLAHFRTMTRSSSSQVTADELRKKWKGKHHPNSSEAEDFYGVVQDFRTLIFSTSRRKNRRTNSFTRTYNISFKEALGSISEDDQQYLRWFMSDRDRDPYTFLEIDQDALATQTAIYYVQNLHRCLGDKPKRGERCYAVFSNKNDPGNSSILAMQSDRLEVLRLVSLPHLDRKMMLPLYPLYLRRFGHSPSRIRDQRWVYFHAVKSMIVYFCSLIDPKMNDAIFGVTSMGTPLFPEIYMRIPQIIDLFAETESDVVKLLKESYTNPQSSFLRSLKAFLLQDKLHYINKEALSIINLWFKTRTMSQRDRRERFPAQTELLHKLSLTMNRRAHEGKWIPIQKPVVNVKPDGHKVQSRKDLELHSSNGNLVDTDNVPLHALLYQLVWTNDECLTKEERRAIFMSIVVDPEMEESYTFPKCPGARLWVTMTESMARYEEDMCDDHGEDEGSGIVKSPWELCNMARFLGAFETASRFYKEESKYSGGLCNFKLKNLVQGDKDLPVFAESARSVIHFGEFFPAIEPHIDLSVSSRKVGLQLTREFLEFHYLARIKTYFRDESNWSSSFMKVEFCQEEEEDEEEEEEPIGFFTDEMVYNAMKKAKTVRRVTISH